MQLVELGGYGARLEITDTSKDEGEIVLQGGLVFSARYRGLTGSEALLSLLGVRDGEFSLYASRAEHSAEAPLDAPRTSSLLLEFLRLEDELAHYADTRLPAEHPLALRGVIDATEGPGGEGSQRVIDAILARPGVSQSRLLSTLPVTPQRVALTVAWLNARGRLELTARPRASSKIGLISAAWLARLMDWKQGRLRLLVACPEGISADDMRREVAALQQGLKAAPFSFESSGSGPTFVRLRSALGGVLSITFLPLSRRHRFLFQTFARGVDLALVPHDLDASARASLLPDVPEAQVLALPETSLQGGLSRALQIFAEQL